MSKTLRGFVLLLVAGLPLIAAAPVRAAPAEHGLAEAEVAFTYGVRAFNRGEYAEAIRLFQEAVTADSGNGTARYWLGLAHLRAGDAASAAREIEASLAAARPPEVERSRVLSDLETARRGGQPELLAVPGFPGERIAPAAAARRLDGRVGAAYGTIKNPAQLAPGYQAVFPGRIVSESDSDTVTNLDLRLDLRPFLPAGDWSFGLRLEGAQASYADLDSLETRTLRGQAQLAWGRSPSGFVTGPLGFARVAAGRTPVIVLVQAGVEDTEVDGKAYLRTGRAAASLTVPEGPRAATETRLEAAYQDLNYHADFLPLLQRDGKVVSLKAGQVFYVTDRNHYLLLSATAGKRSAGDALAYGFHEGGIEVSWPLGSRLSLQAAGSVRKEDYDEPESNPRGSRRSDTVLKAGGTLTWLLPRGLRPYLSASYTDRDSNYVPLGADPPRDFRRTEAGIGLTWSF